MKFKNLFLPGVALATAAGLFTFTPQANGYGLLGFTLGLGQRDFRIFNNFTDATANNNQTPDVNFPGYQGADMAIWKGCVEWSSHLHGNGDGDPSQPFGLGSGGANFDPSFQGNHTAVGGVNDNVHSELAGMDGGVLAFAEGPGTNGWRIRYYDFWQWVDGPGTGFTTSGNKVDLQGVACHEYGHALGMGHSGVGAATMAPSISGTGTSARSIHSDDILGVQAAYGVAGAAKPRITGMSASGSQITVTGTGFTASGNELWFTQMAAGGAGTPIKVTGLSSVAGGTQIQGTIPAAAGPGDVLVKKGAAGSTALSNPWPFDFGPGGGGCATPVNYCVGAPNSVGAGATISTIGSQDVDDATFGLSATGLVPFQNGIFFYGPNQTSFPFGDGFLCIAGGTFRLPIVQADSGGSTSHLVDFSAPPTAQGQITNGSSWNFQYWYRDPGGVAAFNLTDGIFVEFCN